MVFLDFLIKVRGTNKTWFQFLVSNYEKNYEKKISFLLLFFVFVAQRVSTRGHPYARNVLPNLPPFLRYSLASFSIAALKLLCHGGNTAAMFPWPYWGLGDLQGDL